MLLRFKEFITTESFLDKHYYPVYWSGCYPIHAVRDWLKVRNLVRACKNGEAHKIPPIYTDGELGNGTLLTGTHRSAANDLIKKLNDRNGTNIDLINHRNVSHITDKIELDDGDLQDHIDYILRSKK